jgi:hypothetical protein
MSESPELHEEKILELEFEYARETAMQAQSDRTVVVNLYLILVGGVGSLLLAVTSFSGAGNSTLTTEAVGGLFLLIAVLGFLTLFKLIRLREAWYDSAATMNVIKKYYLERFPDLVTAFRWHPTTIPALDKPWSITFILSAMVMLLDCAALGGGVYFLSGFGAGPGAWLAAGAALLGLGAQLRFYFYELSRGKKDRPRPTPAGAGPSPGPA